MGSAYSGSVSTIVINTSVGSMDRLALLRAQRDSARSAASEARAAARAACDREVEHESRAELLALVVELLEVTPDMWANGFALRIPDDWADGAAFKAALGEPLLDLLHRARPGHTFTMQARPEQLVASAFGTGTYVSATGLVRRDWCGVARAP
jgi:hypothetical protein